MKFVGYSDVFNTYRVYDTERKRVIKTCDAVPLGRTEQDKSRQEQHYTTVVIDDGNEPVETEV